MKANPFDRFIKNETALHFAVAEYLQLQYPTVRWFHSPNEGKRSPFERYLVSKMGISKGYPDFVIYGAASELALELKWNTNTPTPEQEGWLNFFLKKGGAISFVTWSFNSAKEIIDGVLRPQKIIGVGEVNNSYLVLLNDDLPTKIKKHIK